MIFFLAFFSLASFSVGLLNVYLTWDLSKKYCFPYLRSYFASILFSTLFGFLDIVCRNVIQGVLQSQSASPHALTTAGLVFNLLALPFMIVSWYFFIAMIRGFAGKGLSLGIKAGFFILQGVMTLIFGFLIADYAGQKAQDFSNLSRTVLSAFNVVSTLIILGALAQLLFYLKDVGEKTMRKAARDFGLIYLLAYVIYRIRIDALGFLAHTQHAYALLHFAVHLPPLLYLRRVLRIYYLNHPLQPAEPAQLRTIFSGHNITERESDIILLLLKGKSNREIAQDLFISSHTVRNHLHNIFQKLKIKSRHQLTNYIFNSLDAERSERKGDLRSSR